MTITTTTSLSNRLTPFPLPIPPTLAFSFTFLIPPSSTSRVSTTSRSCKYNLPIYRYHHHHHDRVKTRWRSALDHRMNAHHEPSNDDLSTFIPTSDSNYSTVYSSSSPLGAPTNGMINEADTNPAVDIGGTIDDGNKIGDKGNNRNGGNDGGNDPSESNDDDNSKLPSDAEISALLASYGRSGEILAPELRTLTMKRLKEYLNVSENLFVNFMNRLFPSWRRRVAADPTFPFKLLMEETAGLALAASGMIMARGKNIWNELDFAFCDIAVGGTVNFLLVWLLSPTLPIHTVATTTTATTPFSTSLITKNFSNIITSLPANIFAYGSYGMSVRFGGFLYKGILFSLCGFGASIIGTTISQGLLKVRKLLGKEMSGKKLPNLWSTSIAWAIYMFFSSNPRYQAVAGFERFMFSNTPQSVAKLSSGAARTINNIVGGAHWVWWVKYLGIQDTESK